MQFDIKGFYPAIKEILLHEAIQFAKEHVLITRKDVEVIFLGRKPVLNSDGEPWVKKEGEKKSTFYKNYNRFWVAQNSYPIIENINIISSSKKAREISTFDFSTLYTNLPHQDFIRFLHNFVEFSFNSGCNDQKGYRKYLKVVATACVWTKKKRGYNSYIIQQIKIMKSP